jgi:rsbT co-antagonist protein RsbR
MTTRDFGRGPVGDPAVGYATHAEETELTSTFGATRRSSHRPPGTIDGWAGPSATTSAYGTLQREERKMGDDIDRRGDLPLGLTLDTQAGLEDFWAIWDKSYEQVSDEAIRRLADDREFGPIIQSTSAEELQAQDRESRDRIRRAVMDGEWDEYVQNLRSQGAMYAQMGISFSSWFRVLNVFRPILTGLLLDAFGDMPSRFRAAMDAMGALIDGAMALVGEEYLDAKERIIAEQQEAIREFSTPVLQINDELLLLPLVGVIDSHRARQMTDQVLQAIRVNRGKVIVIDITGVPAVDSMVANHLVQLVEASRLLGARAILTGLSGEVAQTLVRIGVDLANVQTCGNLADGVTEAYRRLGYPTARETSEPR